MAALTITLIGAGGLLAISTMCAFAWYRIVDPSQAHLVVTPKTKFVVSSDDKVSTSGKQTYFAIPSSIPFFGRAIRVLDVRIKELVNGQETYEENDARYYVKSSTKYRIVDIKRAAETFTNDKELKEHLKEIVESSVRAVTVQYNVTDARAKKSEMDDKIRVEMEDDFAKFGLELISFQLVDFRDTADSTVISDISQRREVEIKSTTREMNAEKEKLASIKESDSIEKSRKREIEKDQVIAEQEQIKNKLVAEKQKEATEQEYEVIKVQEIKQAEINKDKAVIIAEQQKEVALIEANKWKEAEEINKTKKQLAGEGDRLKAEEVAKAEAEPILRKGLAEAKVTEAKGLAEAQAKEKLQAALNKFTPAAIQTLTAELIVKKDMEIGVATAKALEKADLKVFSGGDGKSSTGFDLGKLVSSVGVADDQTAKALLNKIARPNDLGMTSLEAPKEKLASKKDLSSKKSLNKGDKK